MGGGGRDAKPGSQCVLRGALVGLPRSVANMYLLVRLPFLYKADCTVLLVRLFTRGNRHRREAVSVDRQQLQLKPLCAALTARLRCASRALQESGTGAQFSLLLKASRKDAVSMCILAVTRLQVAIGKIFISFQAVQGSRCALRCRALFAFVRIS